MIEEFKGFHEETLKFLLELKFNNTKEWFDENRDRFEEHIMEPSRSFVLAMKERLMEISPGIIAEPKVNRSLFRLNRDIRFSNDKSPYKTHIGIIFWEGPRKRMECPGFYFHLEPDSMMMAGGFHILPKDLIEPFRKVISDEKKAGELAGIIAEVEKGGIPVGGLHYKRTPRGYCEDHPYSYLLKYNGVYGMEQTEIPEEFFNSKLIDLLLEKFRIMDPLNRWFLEYLY